MWKVEYYEQANGNCPVAEFLDALEPKLTAKALRSIDLLEEKGVALREPYVKHIDGAIWELRVKFASDITRIFYFAADEKIVLLHGFVKKTQKTPPREIAIAKGYYDDYRRRKYDARGV